MKNIPKKIFLNLGISDFESTEEIDFKDLGGVTFSEGRVFDEDIEYVLASMFDTLARAYERQRNNYHAKEKEQDAAIGIMTRKLIAAEEQILVLYKDKINLIFDLGEARDALKDMAAMVIKSFEDDGLDNMSYEDQVIYDKCKKIVPPF